MDPASRLAPPSSPDSPSARPSGPLVGHAGEAFNARKREEADHADGPPRKLQKALDPKGGEPAMDPASSREAYSSADPLSRPPSQDGKQEVSDESTEELSDVAEDGSGQIKALQERLHKAAEWVAPGDAQEYFKRYDNKSRSLSFLKDDGLFQIIDRDVGKALAFGLRELERVNGPALIYTGNGPAHDGATFVDICEGLSKIPQLKLIDLEIEKPDHLEWRDAHLLDFSRLGLQRVWLHPSAAFKLTPDCHIWLRPSPIWTVSWYGEASEQPAADRFPSINESHGIHIWGIPAQRVHLLTHHSEQQQIEIVAPVELAGDSKSAAGQSGVQAKPSGPQDPSR